MSVRYDSPTWLRWESARAGRSLSIVSRSTIHFVRNAARVNLYDASASRRKTLDAPPITPRPMSGRINGSIRNVGEAALVSANRQVSAQIAQALLVGNLPSSSTVTSTNLVFVIGR